MLDFGAALDCVLAKVSKAGRLSRVIVSLNEAAGRVLAEDVLADRDQPPFDRSTRDGFAVCAAEGVEPRRVVGTLRAGEVWTGEVVRAGEAVEIMTGAAVPAGTDAVLMVEHVEREGDRIRLAEGRMVSAGLNIVERGTEARAGQVVLRAGSLLGAAEIAVAASCGCGKVSVFERPAVAVIATGDELVELDARPEPGPGPGPMQIWNSNGPALGTAVRAEGGRADVFAAAPDERHALRERIVSGTAADLLVLSGGVSMGKYDLVEEVLHDLGAEFFFTGVKMQPGKPVVFGRLPKRVWTPVEAAGAAEWVYFFGLPGNPVSTQVTFALFVAPVVRALAGRSEIAPRFLEARLGGVIEGVSDRTRFLPAEVNGDWRGVTVTPVGWKGSGDVAANVRGNAYVVLPAGVERWAEGETVRVLLR